MWNWETVNPGIAPPALVGTLNSRLRQLVGTIAELVRRLEGVSTWTDGDTTPSVRGGAVFETANTGATSITQFDDGRRGQTIKVVFTDANTTLVDGTNLKTSDGNDYTGAAGKVLQFVSEDGTVFREVPTR